MAPSTYHQLIEYVLTDAAKERRERFSLTWLRQKIRTRARKVKKRLGPRLNKAILRVLTDGEKLGYLRLDHGRRASDISIYMSEGGRHEYTHKTTTVTVEAQVSMAKTRNELRQENEKLKTDLLEMEIRLARANSLLDVENSGHVEVVTGTPAIIMDRIKSIIVQSKNRKHQISLMYAANDYRHNEDLLNDYCERGMQEQEVCDAEEGELAVPERGNEE